MVASALDGNGTETGLPSHVKALYPNLNGAEIAAIGLSADGAFEVASIITVAVSP